MALRILQLKNPDGSYLIPSPQTILTGGASAGLGFSSYSEPSTYNENQYLVNGDYSASTRNTISGRLYLATIDQFRTFGSPQGYPGTPIVPGDGTPQALQAHDYVASLNLTTAFTRSVVNEARMSFTRSVQGAHGVGYAVGDFVGYDSGRPVLRSAARDHRAGPAGQLPRLRQFRE